MTTDISEEVTSICSKLGIENKALVSRIVLDPTVATLTVFTQDSDGFKVLDTITGQPSVQTFTYDVLT